MFFRCACLPIPSYRNTLLAALSDIMHRNTKDHVKEDLSIPAQEEHIFPVSLNEVEREYYSQQSESCQDDLHAVLGANPSAQLPELDALKLRKWLLRLRQTCVHPQIGQENQRTLGTKPIQGINDLLHWMARECASELLSAERQLLATRIRRAQALEQRASFQDALDLYQQLLSDVEKSVAEARVEVVTNRDSLGVVAGRVDAAGNSDACEATDQDRQEKIVGATARLNSWLQVEHRLVFFIALIHEKLKDKALEKHLFDRAEGIRRELLGPWIQDVESETMKIKESIGNGTLNLQIPMSAFDGGLTVQELCLQSQATLAALNKQGANLVAWRKKILDVLMADLDRAKPAENANDQDNAVAGNHTSVEVIDEDAQYQISLLVQEEVNSYQDVYKESLLDRITLLIGAARPPESEEHAKKSAILTQLAKERIIPTNLRDLKALVSGFRVHGQARAGVPELELQLCQNESRRLNKELERAMKMLDSLKR